METESQQSAGADASAMPWLDNLKELIGKYQLPGVMLRRSSIGNARTWKRGGGESAGL